MPFPFSANDCAARPSRPPSRRTSGLHALLAGLASAVLLAACGGSGSGSDQAAATAATAAPRLLASASAARAAVAADYTVLLQRVYLAYFGRPADPAGLAYYAAGFAQAGAPTALAGLLAAYASNPTVKGAIDGFGSSAESQALYPGNNAAFITAVYANLFNRAPDAAGRAYWAGLLDSGAMTRGSAALAIMNGAQAGDATIVANKAQVAVNFTALLISGPQLRGYDGLAANARARALLARVTLATDLTAFQDDVGAAAGALAAPGIHLLAGSAVGAGNLDGIGAAASFGFESGSYVNVLTGVASDSAGNCYVSDYHNQVIRKITPAGVVSTYAGDKGGYGHVDGPVAQARFANPTGLAIDANDNMYVGGDHEIRKITPAGIVTTFAGGDYRTSLIEQPAGLAVDGAGNVYVADSARHRVVKINVAGFISAIIGAGEAGSADGPAASAQFNAPQGISVDADGMVYVADAGNGTIRRIGSDGAVTTIAGQAGGWGDADGSAAQARFFRPIALTAAAGTLYVVDSYAYTVRKISGANGAAAVTSTFAMRRNEPGATSGNGVSAVLHGPTGIARDRAGVLFATSQWALSRIAADGATSTLAGVGWPPNLGSFNPSFDGVGAKARFGSLLLSGLIADGSGGAILSENASSTIRRVTATGAVTTVTAHITYASGSVYEQRAFSEVPGLARGADGTLYLGGGAAISKLAPDGTLSALAGRPSFPGLVDGRGAAARFGTIRALQLDLAGNLYVAENQQGLPGTTLRKVTPAGVVSTFAQLDDVLAVSMAIDPAGNLYLPDWSSGLIRKLSPAGVLSTLAGVPGAVGDNDGPAGVARFLSPRAIAYDPAGKLYVVDNGSHLLREVALDGTVTTVAGTRGSYGLGPDGPLPGSLPTAHAIASVAPKVLLIATESGVVEIALP